MINDDIMTVIQILSNVHLVALTTFGYAILADQDFES